MSHCHADGAYHRWCKSWAVCCMTVSYVWKSACALYRFLWFCWQDASLAVQSVELRGGRAKCPYDPSSNYTIIYVGEANIGCCCWATMRRRRQLLSSCMPFEVCFSNALFLCCEQRRYGNSRNLKILLNFFCVAYLFMDRGCRIHRESIVTKHKMPGREYKFSMTVDSVLTRLSKKNSKNKITSYVKVFNSAKPLFDTQTLQSV